MWLINTTTLKLEQVVDELQCPYVILSHTWMPRGEVTFQDMRDTENVAARKPGFEKIRKTCEIARRGNNEYAWVDTCCIDKTSSAELSEAINSMFRWYRNATTCYVFLSDLEPLGEMPIDGYDPKFLRGKLYGCKWFTRGWTLQELIAPSHMQFFDRAWNFLGKKSDMVVPLSRITKIDESILRDSHTLHTIAVARRMSWAAARETTRTEDMAYCLLGIFDVNMPMLYGEGQKAFLRLQQQIASEIADLSLFAWQCAEMREYSGLFADSPKDFVHCSQVRKNHTQFSSNEIAITNIGVRLNVPLHRPPNWEEGRTGVAIDLNCVQVLEGARKRLGIILGKHGQTYVRCMPFEVQQFRDEEIWWVRETASPIYVLPRLRPAGVQRMSALSDNVIILQFDRILSQKLSYIEGQPVAAYFPNMTGKRWWMMGNMDMIEGALAMSRKQPPIGMTESRFRELTGPFGGAIFMAQGFDEFVGYQVMNLGGSQLRLLMIIFLKWDGVKQRLYHGIYSEKSFHRAISIYSKLTWESLTAHDLAECVSGTGTEQQRLEAIRRFLVDREESLPSSCNLLQDQITTTESSCGDGIFRISMAYLQGDTDSDSE